MATPALESEIRRYAQNLYESYEAYKVKEVASRRLKHGAMLKILASLQSPMRNKFNLEQIGVSSEGRSINLLTIGSGKKEDLHVVPDARR